MSAVVKNRLNINQGFDRRELVRACNFVTFKLPTFITIFEGFETYSSFFWQPLAKKHLDNIDQAITSPKGFGNQRGITNSYQDKMKASF